MVCAGAYDPHVPREREGGGGRERMRGGPGGPVHRVPLHSRLTTPKHPDSMLANETRRVAAIRVAVVPTTVGRGSGTRRHFEVAV